MHIYIYIYIRGRNAAVKYDFGEHGEKGLYMGRSLVCPKTLRIYKLSTKTVVETPVYIIHNGLHVNTSSESVFNTEFTLLF